jgi:signal transduction histidine kinase
MNNTHSEIENSDINKVLADITDALVGRFKMSALLDQVVETSMRTLEAEVCSIFLEDKRTEPGVLIMMAGSGFAKKLVGEAKYKIGEGFTGTIAKYNQKFNIKSRQELEALEVNGESVWRGKFDVNQWPTGQSEFRNCIALPLKIKDQVLGVIKVENKKIEKGEYFTEEDEKYLEIIANVVALAIENARLHEQIEKQLKAIAAKAAHRINNLLTNYDGIELELYDQLSAPTTDKEQLADIRGRISETTRSLKRMVAEFKGFGIPLMIEKTPTDLNQIIIDEVRIAKMPPEISLDFNLAPDLPKIPLDAGRFNETIKELISNSRKAILKNPDPAKQGKIVISTSLLAPEPSGDNSAKPSYVVVEITDNGPGFPPDFPLFEPFQTTDPQSTGLGLATVKELIESHGGIIEAHNQEGQGVLMRLRLPF